MAKFALLCPYPPSRACTSRGRAGTLHPATTHAVVAPSAPRAIAQLFATADIISVIALLAVVALWVALVEGCGSEQAQSLPLATKFISSATASACRCC
jgi:hypothetical protein